MGDEMKLVVMASNKPKSFKGASSGTDSHHIAFEGNGRTLCGVDCTEWLELETPVEDAAYSAFCCRRCHRQADAMIAERSKP